jgi:predicted metal-dependent peptidase
VTPRSGAIEVAAGRTASLSLASTSKSPAQKARSWFISSYPLLGAMVAGFDLVEDSGVCTRESISVAAVNAFTKEIFINSVLGFSEEECRFVIAHEVLHVGLMHGVRCQGRDPYLWNIACDFVVNGWLVEMGVGSIPRFGALYDSELQGLSAESVYDRIVTDLRRYRKLATFRGIGLGEMLGQRDGQVSDDAQDLDDFYKRALTQGLEYHQASGRGYLPAGLIEEIRALNQPPIPWDVQLANWFDDYFDPLEKRRSYARPSRRQAATPDIPRPRHLSFETSLDGRTYGVVLDTSGSMDRLLLAKALGAIASYSIARDVPAVRVVFCDAAAYDQGFMAPEAIADRVQVRGRGGTVLQPGIDILQRAEDFPHDGPLLVITDGSCDSLEIRRKHAFLIPRGRNLPFVPAGPVFRIE